MRYSPARPWLFGTGFAIAVASVVTGYFIAPGLSALGISGFSARYGFIGALGFAGFAFGVPLGFAISALGAYEPARDPRLYRLYGTVFLLGLVALAVLVPLAAGRHSGALWFGSGGWVLLLLILTTLWLWGARRATLPPGGRMAADLQGAGYVCFALATWNLCGIAAMPSFALEPERMLALESRAFAVGQTKTVMVLLLLGWLCTAWGYRKELQRRSLPDGEAAPGPARR